MKPHLGKANPRPRFEPITHQSWRLLSQLHRLYNVKTQDDIMN